MITETEIAKQLANPNNSLTDEEESTVQQCLMFLGDLEDHVLAEVTRAALATCAFRMVHTNSDTSTGILPSRETMKHSLKMVCKIIRDTINDNY